MKTTEKEKAMELITDLHSKVNLKYAVIEEYKERKDIASEEYASGEAGACISAIHMIARAFGLTFSETLEAMKKSKIYH